MHVYLLHKHNQDQELKVHSWTWLNIGYSPAPLCIISVLMFVLRFSGRCHGVLFTGGRLRRRVEERDQVSVLDTTEEAMAGALP